MARWKRSPEGQLSSASFCGSLYRLAYSMAVLPVLLLLLCSGRVGECTDDCPLVKNGRLAECTRYVNITSQSTDHEVLEKCRKQHLQKVPACLASIVDECNKIMKPGQEQVAQLNRTVNYWLKRAENFDKHCAEFVELHHSASSASEDGNYGQRHLCPVTMVIGSLIVCFVSFRRFVSFR